MRVRQGGDAPRRVARSVRAAIVLTLIGAPAAAQLPAAPSAVLAAWVEFGTAGPVVRAITTAAFCPRAASIDSPIASPAWGAPMVVREGPSGPDFPNLVCEWQPPSTTQFIAIEGAASVLRMPVATPRRIVVLADTGCFGGSQQNCEHDWPFPAIARFAAARQPDLVLHLGDYNYRGTACVAYDGCCDYNPINCGFPNCGDSWSNWQQDFFDPAAPLLAAAPWLTVRGNHELCGRAGRGWFRYLDPHSPPLTCEANPVINPTYTAPFPVYIGSGVRIMVMDSASACGEKLERNDIAEYHQEFERLAEHVANGAAEQTWLVSHRALWGLLQKTQHETTVLNYTLQQASGNHVPAAISLILSGHEHLFQSIAFENPAMPRALIVGTGGAELDNPADLPAVVEAVPIPPDGPTIALATTLHDHGYLLMELSTGGWTATFYDLYDQPLARCDPRASPALCTLVTP
jgi:hypothetical protein